MINAGMEPSETAESALSFLSKGLREDLQLMRARAKSFKSIADRELENFLNSAQSSPFPQLSPAASDLSIAEFDFVKRIRPKLSEIRRAYSSPDFLEKWTGGGRGVAKSSIRINLPSIRTAIVSEVNDAAALWDVEGERFKVRRRRRIGWKGKEEDQKEWEPIRLLKKQLKEFERKSQTTEIFSNFKSNELVEKVKLSLVPLISPTLSHLSIILYI